MARKNKRNNQSNSSHKVTWAQAFRDVLVAAMNRGQLLMLLAGGGVTLAIYKVPSEEMSQLIRDVLSSAQSMSILSYIVNVILVLLLFYQGKKFRRMHSEEFKRVGTEKQKAQKGREIAEERLKK